MMHQELSLLGLMLKTVAAHTVTYVFTGILALTLLDYRHWFAEPPMNAVMRQVDDPWVMAGPLFQPVRGVLFAIAFYPLREVVFERRSGWLVLWLELVILGILAPLGPAPGSVEGLIYTTWPLRIQMLGLPEVLLQSLLFSLVLHNWVRRHEQKWLNWTLGMLFILSLLLPALGLMSAQGR